MYLPWCYIDKWFWFVERKVVLVGRKDIDANEHERLSHFTL
jgi:hypothetical protein